MWEYVLYGAAVVLSLLGLVEIIRSAALLLLSAKNAPEQFLLVMLDDDNAEPALRYALETAKYLPCRRCRIVAVDTGLSREACEICRRLCDDAGCILFCTPDGACELIRGPGVPASREDGYDP